MEQNKVQLTINHIDTLGYCHSYEVCLQGNKNYTYQSSDDGRIEASDSLGMLTFWGGDLEGDGQVEMSYTSERASFYTWVDSEQYKEIRQVLQELAGVST